jgi:hypothetical protein
MALASPLERIVGTLFGSDQGGADDPADQALVRNLTELIVDTLEPRLRLLARYDSKLAGGVRQTIAHFRSFGKQPLEPILLARKAWSEDARQR